MIIIPPEIDNGVKEEFMKMLSKRGRIMRALTISSLTFLLT